MPPGDFSVLEPKHSRYTKAGPRFALGDSPPPQVRTKHAPAFAIYTCNR